MVLRQHFAQCQDVDLLRIGKAHIVLDQFNAVAGQNKTTIQNAAIGRAALSVQGDGGELFVAREEASGGGGVAANFQLLIEIKVAMRPVTPPSRR